MTTIQVNPAVNVLTTVAERLVTTGMYSSPEKAIVQIALTHIDREIVTLEQQIARWREQYSKTFEEFTAALRNQATMEQEIAWEEWDDARLKLAIRRKSKQELLSYVARLN